MKLLSISVACIALMTASIPGFAAGCLKGAAVGGSPATSRGTTGQWAPPRVARSATTTQQRKPGGKRGNGRVAMNASRRGRPTFFETAGVAPRARCHR